jgi:hypothetical protein
MVVSQKICYFGFMKTLEPNNKDSFQIFSLLHRLNFQIIILIGLTLLHLHCGGKSSEAETQLVPILLSADTNSLSVANRESLAGIDAPAEANELPEGFPILNQIKYLTNDAHPDDDPNSTRGLLQFPSSTSVTFLKPVPTNTEISLFFGKKNMEIAPDGTVTNALKTIKSNVATFNGYTYLVDSDKKYKVFVVAQNEFGKSMKQLLIGHARNCANAIKENESFGDCNDHCFETKRVGESIEIEAKYNLPVDAKILKLDLVGGSPRSLPDNIAPSVNLKADFPKPGYYKTKTNFNIDTKDYLCTKVESLLITDQPFRTSFLKGYLSIPNQ